MHLLYSVRRVLIFFQFVLVISGCGSGGSSQSIVLSKSETYDPYSLGNSWNYKVVSSQNGYAPATYTSFIKVTGNKMINGVNTTVVTETNPDNSGVLTERYYLTSNEGIFYYGTNTSTSALKLAVPYLRVLKFPLTIGDSFVQLDQQGLDYPQDLDLDGKNETIDIHSEVSVVGIEPVTVDAGTFDSCSKVQTSIIETLTLSSNNSKKIASIAITEWYAPGIGLVKRHYQTTVENYSSAEDYILVSYNINGTKNIASVPTVTSNEPTDTVSGVAAENISATFNEEMDIFTLNSNSLFIRNSAGQSFPGTISYSNNKVTFTPSTILPSDSYIATISRAVQDVNGNNLAGDYTWSFYVDSTAPTVSSTYPASSAASVPLDTVVSATFSEDMDFPATTYYDYMITLTSASGSTVQGSESYTGRTVTFTPNAKLMHDTKYTATISAAYKDKVGNPMTTSYSWEFTTDPGMFMRPVSFQTASHPEAVAIGDVNGDGKNDVVVVTSYSDTDVSIGYKLLVYLQNSSGGLDPAIEYQTSGKWNYAPSTVAIGDLNGDGRNDVIVGNSGLNIEIFYQDSSGRLVHGNTYPTTDSYKIKLADLNKDGLLDVISIGWGKNTASIWLQKSDGTLSPPVTYPVTNSGMDLSIGDVNNDGFEDIVLLDAVLPGNGDGTFNPAYYFYADTGCIAVGDVNGDNLKDVIVEGGVFYQNNSGSLLPLVNKNFSSIVKVADVNNDGRLDVIDTTHGWYNIDVFLQKSDGTLSEKDQYSGVYGTWNTDSVAIGDINSDGFNDIVIADECAVAVVYNRGTSVVQKAVSSIHRPNLKRTAHKFKGIKLNGMIAY